MADMTVEEKYALLRTNSFKERGLLVQEALMRFKGTIDLQIDLNKMDDPEATSYKKAAITKQIGMSRPAAFVFGIFVVQALDVAATAAVALLLYFLLPNSLMNRRKQNNE